MEMTSKQDIASHLCQPERERGMHSIIIAMRTHCKTIILLVLTTLLLCGSTLLYIQQPGVSALSRCTWYKIHRGDTLSGIASRYNTDISTLAQTNHISNVNLIISGKTLCIPHSTTAHTGTSYQSLYMANQVAVPVRASRVQVAQLLSKAASRHHIPANLVKAIAWQESGWNQSAISPDGGIGIMQIMPYTATWLNSVSHTHYNPHRLQDNIQLGTIYLHILWGMFHGNLVDVISAYNEGAWNVTHRGIFNWAYVNSVLSLMKRF